MCVCVLQIVYYFYGYFQAKKQAQASGLGWSGKVQFCVPSGNFGNALACYYAQQMGVPIAKIVVATNANDILHRCVRGTWEQLPHQSSRVALLTHSRKA